MNAARALVAFAAVAGLGGVSSVLVLPACGGALAADAASADASSDNDALAAQGREPGRIACGGFTVCDARKNEYCCLAADGTGTCRQLGSKSVCEGVSLTCDDTTDCPADRKTCCLRPGPEGLGESGRAACEPSCIMDSESYQLCATSDECETNSCFLQVCSNHGYATCGPIYGKTCR